MQPHDYIQYGRKKYPLFFLDIPDEDGNLKQRTISVDSLGIALIGSDGMPVNAEAEKIDNSIFFYIPDFSIEYEWDEEFTIKYITGNL